MSTDKAVERANKAYSSLEYPMKPIKPVKVKGESNTNFGERMDIHELDLSHWRLLVKDYRDAGNRINSTFKKELLEALGIAKHPKADMLYDRAWEDGYSSGYSEVTMIAEDLVNLLS